MKPYTHEKVEEEKGIRSRNLFSHASQMKNNLIFLLMTPLHHLKTAHSFWYENKNVQQQIKSNYLYNSFWSSSAQQCHGLCYTNIQITTISNYRINLQERKNESWGDDDIGTMKIILNSLIFLCISKKTLGNLGSLSLSM